MGRERAATWYQGSKRTENGRILTLEGLLFGMPRHRRHEWLPAFWLRVNKGDNEDACWLWMGARTSDNYGIVNVNRHIIRAHRLSLLIAKGSLSLDRYVLHRCDCPPCVNPAHLFLGSAADNAADMRAKHRHSRRKLTTSAAREIRTRYANGETLRALAFRFQVSRSTIWHVTSGRTWRDAGTDTLDELAA